MSTTKMIYGSTYPKGEKEREDSLRTHQLFKLFYKQIIASVIFGLAALFCQAAPIPACNRCADALGDALRHSSDLRMIKEKGEAWIRQGLSSYRLPIYFEDPNHGYDKAHETDV